MKNSNECKSNNILAIARWEDNRKGWLSGDFFGLASNDQYLQNIVGTDGTLWIVVSRERPGGGRLFSVMFQLQNCKLVTYDDKGKFGKYAVVGDPNKSKLYASNDSELLLMSLRFDPEKPISQASKIGQSIQRPRCLSNTDVDLLEKHISRIDRWSVFVSYKRDNEDIANKLSNSLQGLGVNLFLDHKSISPGTQWETVIIDAVKRSRCLIIIIIGSNTHKSEWVKKEIELAISSDVHLIPIIAGGKMDDWSEIPELFKRQAIPYKGNKWNDFVSSVVNSLPSIYA